MANYTGYGEPRITTTVRITLSNWQYAKAHGIEPTAVLNQALGQLRLDGASKQADLVQPEEIEQEVAGVVAAKRKPGDYGPKTADESSAYVKWLDEHPQYVTMDRAKRFKLWREETGA